MYNYCTLFDSNYLTRGLAMYESLKKHSDNFHLYIFAFNDLSYDLLKKLNLKFVTVISLKEFEDEELLRIKATRSTGEYCWTCTPSIIKYAIETYDLDNCTYLDADLYFYSNPCVLIQEMGDSSVLITEHRYTPEYDQSQTSGIYCVQFMTFKNDINGMKVLNWWKDACNKWCYARYEDGKFGDQKYLDDWTTKFEDVCELQNLGGGVAPWNVQQYNIIDENNKIYGIDKSTNKKFELVFYHFHNYKILENNKIECGMYRLDKNDIKILYKSYTKELDIITKKLNKIDSKNDYNGIVDKKNFYWKDQVIVLKRYIKNTYNVFDIKKLLREK
jgi:hypothetical protein